MSSLTLKFLDETSKIVPVVTALVCLYTCSAGVLFFTMGALACTLSARLVKSAIRQRRPAHGHRTSYGMPSTHASVCTFFAASVFLSSIFLPLHYTLHPLAVFAPFVVVPWAGMIVLSRVWLGYHTWPQVVGGVGFGVFFASMWFRMWTEDVGSVATLGGEVERLIHNVTSRPL